MRGRHVTTAVTLLVLLGILVFGVAYGVKSLVEPIGQNAPAASPTPTCTSETVKKGKKLSARQVQVSVFNAGSTAGLADKTMLMLQQRGFVKGDIGNAPAGTKLKRVRVWTTKNNDPTAALVARQFGPKTPVMVVKRDLGVGVDVLVADGLSGLKKARTKVKVTSDVSFCAPEASSLGS